MEHEAISFPDDMCTRRVPREDTVRIVEYTPFPRAARQQARVGFTRDLSAEGMCVGVDEVEEEGSLLRVVVRDADGRSLSASIARVVWWRAARDGRFWLGLDLLTNAPPPGDQLTAA